MTTKTKATLKFVLGYLPTFLLGASVWLIPYWGFLATGYANVIPVVFLSIVAVLAGLILLAITQAIDEDFDIFMVFGLIISFVMWVTMFFTTTFVGANDMMVTETNSKTEVTRSDSARVYPFWNDDFILVEDGAGVVAYSMATRCETGICEVRSTVTYTVDAAFVAQHAHSVTDYAPIMKYALEAAIIRDEASTIAAVEAAVCSNFKARLGLAENAACPVAMKVALTVTQK